jgi:DNA-binding CsgD family transcriptional regulator/GAF domain-containing protein
MNDDDDILQVQRALRRRLFEGDSAMRWRPGRELAAQLLLYLDDPQACWRITTEWLRDILDADRVDGGFGGYVGATGKPRDYVVMAEAQRRSMPLPSVLGLRFNAANPGIRAVWSDVGAAAIADVSQERSFTEDLRGVLLSAGTAAKLAVPVRDGARPIGLICADWHHEAPRWKAEVCNELGGLAQGALGPLLAATAQLALERSERDLPAPGRSHSGHDAPQVDPPTVESGRIAHELDVLTSAELKVARLVVIGLSYKEVARRLDRSVSTVDHQLRSIRDKLGARSTAKLVHRLNECL